MTTSGTTSDNEWQRVVQRVTTSDNKWQRVTTNDNEQQQVTASGTTNEKHSTLFKPFEKCDDIWGWNN